jgi:hypothetical protein
VSVHLRRLLPLIAVAGLLAPAAANAATPTPDLPPAAAALAPDPVPTKQVVTHTVRTPLTVTPSVSVAPRRTVVVRAPVTTPRPKPHKHRPAPVKHRAHSIPIVDVAPSFIDLHPGLGAIPTLPRDDSKLVLAAAALLAAAAAAGTGTMLTLTARGRP